MSEFKTRNLTNQGLNLIASAINGGSIEFTKIQLGSGTYDGDTSEATSLIELRHTLPINKIERKGSNVILNASLLAKDIKESFYWREIGVWAKGSDGKEILYLYSYTNKASYISAEMQNEKLIQLIVMVGNVENVKVTIDNSLVYLTKADLEPMLDELRNKDKELKKEIDDLALQIGNIRLDWDSIENRPDKFPPEEHPHNASDIIGLPTSLPANGGNADTVDNKHASDFALVDHDHNTQYIHFRNLLDVSILNNANYGFSYIGNTNKGIELGLKNEWQHVIYSKHSNSDGYGCQIFIPYNNQVNEPIHYRYGVGTIFSNFVSIYDAAHRPSCADVGAAPAEHGHNNATQSASGMMSPGDKAKLDNIAANANNYALPVASSTTRGGVKTGYTTSGKNYAVQLSNEKMYVNVPWTDTNTTYSNATQSTSGLMSNTDKTKLDGIATGANKTTINNTFTSTSTTEGLSAARGKELKELTDSKLAKSGGDVTGRIRQIVGTSYKEPTGNWAMKVINGTDGGSENGLHVATRWGNNNIDIFRCSKMWTTGVVEEPVFRIKGLGDIWASGSLEIVGSIISRNMNLVDEINNLKKQLEGAMKPEKYVERFVLSTKDPQGERVINGSGYLYIDYGSLGSVNPVSRFDESFELYNADGTPISKLRLFENCCSDGYVTLRVPYRDGIKIIKKTAPNSSYDVRFAVIVTSVI